VGDGHTRDIPGCLPVVHKMLASELVEDAMRWKEGVVGCPRTVVAETLRGRADLYMIAPSVRHVDTSNESQDSPN
jgi:hypothetical protein